MYRLLVPGDIVGRDDEWLQGDAVTWLPTPPWAIGMQYAPGPTMLPARRVLAAGEMSVSYPLPKIDEPPPCTKVTDIRKLAERLGRCDSCGGVGDKRRLLSLDSVGIEGLHHGTCAVKVMSADKVLCLPREQLEKLRLNETGVKLMKQILDRKERMDVGARISALEEAAEICKLKATECRDAGNEPQHDGAMMCYYKLLSTAAAHKD